MAKIIATTLRTFGTSRVLGRKGWRAQDVIRPGLPASKTALFPALDGDCRVVRTVGGRTAVRNAPGSHRSKPDLDPTNLHGRGPGNLAIALVGLVRDRDRTAHVQGVCKVDGEIVVEAEMLFSYTDVSYLNG